MKRYFINRQNTILSVAMSIGKTRARYAHVTRTLRVTTTD